MGFEPTRAEPNGLAVHRLNHSATSSTGEVEVHCRAEACLVKWSWGNKFCPKILRENMVILVIQVSYDYQDSVV